MKTVKIDTKKLLGPIKPLNGVGGGPRSANFVFNAINEFRDAGIPYARTHDIEYPFGSGEFVDIHCVFPVFDMDPDDPASYNFVLTDEYLKGMLDAGTKPFYRLGSTIEHQPIKRHVHPPKDFKKWGEICSHIISHYNEGWANGHHWNIEYWEIWNEPDVRPQCWTGTDEEFIAFYETAASVIKNAHPDIKLGGCAITSPFAPLAEKFLAHVKESGAPLDFFSWHGYCHTPNEARSLALKADELLKKYGFEDIESIYNEWNYVCSWGDDMYQSIKLHNTAFAGAFMAAVMTALQDTRTDKSMYYDAQMLMERTWNNIFSPTLPGRHAGERHVICEKPYYALKAWGELVKTGPEAESSADDPDLYIAAAKGDKTVSVLVSYFNDDKCYNSSAPADDDITFELNGAEIKEASAFIIDDDHTFEEIKLDGNTLHMKGNSFAFVKFILK